MLHTGIVNILESVKGRHQGASESGLCGGIHVIPLQASGDLSRTVEVGITEVTTHEKVRALEVIPVSVSPKLQELAGSIDLTALDPRDL